MKSVECSRFCYILPQKSGPGGPGRAWGSSGFCRTGHRALPGRPRGPSERFPGPPGARPGTARGAQRASRESPEPPKSEPMRPKSRLGSENASASRKRCSRIHFLLLFLQLLNTESTRHITSELEQRGREARQVRTRRRCVSYSKNQNKTHVGEKARSCAEAQK